MLKCNYVILSEGVALDQITGLASVYNVLEKYEVPSFPFTINKFYLLAFFEKKSTDEPIFEVEWKLFNNKIEIEGGNSMKKVGLKFDDRTKHKWISAFQGVEIKEEGELSLSIFHEGKEINRYVIEVAKSSQQ